MQAAQGGHANPSVQSRHTAPYLSAITEQEGKMNLIRNYRNWRRYTQTVRELSRLSARELSDVGISRGDIEKVARGAA